MNASKAYICKLTFYVGSDHSQFSCIRDFVGSLIDVVVSTLESDPCIEGLRKKKQYQTNTMLSRVRMITSSYGWGDSKHMDLIKLGKRGRMFP